MTKPQQKFESLKLILPPSPKPLGVYKPFLVDEKHIYLSGHLPINTDNSIIKGKVGQDLDKETAKKAAKQVALTLLSTLIDNLGDLNKIKRVIKVFGMVNCISTFTEHPFVINGCSELFAEIWGTENGISVRSALGVSSLPSNASVEIEAVFELY